MRKAIATVIFNQGYNENGKTYSLYNLTVNHKGENITLLYYDMVRQEKPYKYNSFNEMYKSILIILKNNGFYTGYVEEFGRRFYNIQFIELGYNTISKYGYFPE